MEESGETGSAVHDHVHWLANTRAFNLSVSVAPLLSDRDVATLHKHFVRVELERVARETHDIERRVRAMADELPAGASFPVGAATPLRPPSRYQV